MNWPAFKSAKPAAAPAKARTGSEPAATPAADAAPAAASPPIAMTPARSALVVGGCGGCDCDCDWGDFDQPDPVAWSATASAVETPILPVGRPGDGLGARLKRVDSEMTSSFSDASMPASSCDASSSIDLDLALRLSSLVASASTSSSTSAPSAPDAARGRDGASRLRRVEGTHAAVRRVEIVATTRRVLPDARGARIPRAGSTATGRTPARLARAVECMVWVRIERAERDARWQERSHCAAPTLPLAQNVSPEAEVASSPLLATGWQFKIRNL